jgi:hypothetical protein
VSLAVSGPSEQIQCLKAWTHACCQHDGHTAKLRWLASQLVAEHARRPSPSPSLLDDSSLLHHHHHHHHSDAVGGVSDSLWSWLSTIRRPLEVLRVVIMPIIAKHQLHDLLAEIDYVIDSITSK